MSRLELERRPEGLAVLWLDPGTRRVNTLGPELIDALSGVLDALEADAGVRGVVLASRAEGGFLAGADIERFLDLDLGEGAGVRPLVRAGQALLDRIERLRVPVVAAVDGACMGGGLELALACRAIVASDAPSTRFAQPEVRLGLVPGLGGSQRLPRRVGLPRALDLLLSGRDVFARDALRLGLVDALVHREGLVAAALRAAAGLADGGWRPAPSPPPLAARLLALPGLRGLLWRRAAARVRAEGHGHYPAPERIVTAVRRGVERGAAAGLEAEADAFAELLATPEARALIALFLARSGARRNPWREAAAPVRTVGVAGAGLMGSGIAEVSARAGLEVLLEDRDLTLAAAGKRAVYRGLTRRIGKGLTRFERDRRLERVTPLDTLASLAAADLTIEAVPEDLALKRAVRDEVEAVTGETHVYASNTSSIPITSLADGARRPEAIVGMHYFSPVPRMPLLEVVRTERTTTRALGTAVELGLAQGKVVIVVGDGPGFYTTRILALYMAEAQRLLAEGADVTSVDEAMRAFGFPLGPFALLDDVGLDVAEKIQGVLADLFAERAMPDDGLLARLRAAGYGGRKAGKGFYRYRAARRGRELDRGVYAAAGLGPRRRWPAPDIRDRLALLMLDEAVRCLDEGVLRSATDGDVGAVFGLGFPPYTGGPFRWADRLGAAQVVTRLETLAERHGRRFAPADGLRRLAREGGHFHPDGRPARP